MLGREVVRQLAQCRPEVHVASLDLPEVDIGEASALAACRELRDAEAIINCAGYTDVERAEREESLATRVNGEGVGNLAELARAQDAWMLHISTDYVFDGTATAPYLPEAEPSPLSAYARSKVAGERALREAGGRTCLVRTAWLFSADRGRNFVETIQARAAETGHLAVVADQFGSPTYAVDLASVLIDLLDRGCQGIYHCTNAGVCSWHEFAVEIVRQAGLQARVDAISTAEAMARFGLQARRPAYSALSCASLVAAIGRPMRSWQDALTQRFRAAAKR